jgi:predicted nuclease of predicted toxin-antitoxin system
MSAAPLRFMADENCDHSAVRALRADGHDVVALAETIARSVDDLVVEQARIDRRVLLTEDKDFGWLVFARAAASVGVILIRFPARPAPRSGRRSANWCERVVPICWVRSL